MEETKSASVSEEVGQAAVSKDVETASAVEGSEEIKTEGNEVVEGVETEGKETSEKVEEGKEEANREGEKPPYKLTQQDRIRQLVNEKNELKSRIEGLEKKFEESRKIAIEEKPFIDIDMTRVNEKVASLTDEVESLKIEGKSFEAAQKQREINRLLDAVEENDKKRQEWVKQQSSKEEAVKKYEAKLKYIDDAAEFYRKEANIPQDVWDNGAKFFVEACKKDPVLGREFAEKIESSPIEGIRFATNYVKDNIGKKAEAVKKEKDEAKDKLISTGSTSGIASTAINTFEELHKLSGNDRDKFAKEHPIKYQRILEKRFKGG